MSPEIGEMGLRVDCMSENGSFNLWIRDGEIISFMSGLQVSISTIDKYIPDAVKRAIHDFIYLAKNTIITILPIKYIQKDNKITIYI